VREVAERLAIALGGQRLAPEITGRCRVGDVRHCFPDLTLSRRLLEFEPQVGFDEGVGELVEWLASRQAEDRVESAWAELHNRGLAQ
jgi:dTDP-L-rhamnose 4-epimerase